MTTADVYRLKAAELKTLAERDTNPRLRQEHERLACSYQRLVEYAEQNNQIELKAVPMRSPNRNKKAKRRL